MGDLFDDLCHAEEAARERLLAGCADDAIKIERYFNRPLEIAKRSARNTMAGMGFLEDVDLAAGLRREAFERIGTVCADSICSKAALRVRARFRIYADEIANAEDRIADAIAASRLVHVERIFPRMFSIGWIDFDNLHIPDPPGDDAAIDDWIEHLRRAVGEELAASTKRAVGEVLEQGYARLGVIKSCIDATLRALRRTAQAEISHVGQV
ncbi:MAG TPA: hypothetical protein VMF11_14615 [Candidatus Baltobacteraceae bacterium]|nr:hypothetical protein [Candidatus Baltobacteraceae bacterium]